MSIWKNWKSKIRKTDHFLEKVLPEWRRNKQKVVFTNGCFDLLHAGHIDSLSRAASLGDKLIVAINSDQSVQQLKGPDRPLQNENDRQTILAALSFPDAILIFDELTPKTLIEMITPDTLVKGGDYAINAIEGGEHVIKNGGSIVLLPLIPGRSTTKLAKGSIK